MKTPHTAWNILTHSLSVQRSLSDLDELTLPMGIFHSNPFKPGLGLISVWNSIPKLYKCGEKKKSVRVCVGSGEQIS